MFFHVTLSGNFGGYVEIRNFFLKENLISLYMYIVPGSERDKLHRLLSCLCYLALVSWN